MKLREYQRAARRTDQFPSIKAKDKPEEDSLDRATLIPLLGLTGEVGALLSEYKKLLRDGPAHLNFRERLAEELGDTLWYISTVATKFDLSLEEIASQNLRKVDARWKRPRSRVALDMKYPVKERLPRSFTYRFGYAERDDGSQGVALFDQRGKQLGNLLTDNAHKRDGYRFHDVMHFAFVAILGWSPVARKLLGRKRRSIPATNEIEDGGRASVIDEAIVAMVFTYIGSRVADTGKLRRIDSETLHGIRALTRGFEVHQRTEAEWEEAIVAGLHAWRDVETHDGGTIEGDFVSRRFAFVPPKRRTVARSGARAPASRTRSAGQRVPNR